MYFQSYPGFHGVAADPFGSSRVSASKSQSNMKAKKVFGISLSLILINMASIMERADENLLPAVYKEVSETFSAGPADLGYLTFILKFVQALSSPLAGILSLRYDRPTVLAIGTLWWALSTAAVGVSQQFQQVAFWRAINGFGLAIVIPSLQSFIADSYVDGVRGAGFGLMSLVGAVGGIGGAALSTVMAGREYWDPRKTNPTPCGTGESFESYIAINQETSREMEILYLRQKIPDHHILLNTAEKIHYNMVISFVLSILKL